MNPEGLMFETNQQLWEAYVAKTGNWSSEGTSTTTLSSIGTTRVDYPAGARTWNPSLPAGHINVVHAEPEVYWVTKEGVELRPEDMDREHRENVLNLVLRKLEEQYAMDVQYGRDRVDGHLTPEEIEKKCLKKMMNNPAIARMWKLNGYGDPNDL